MGVEMNDTELEALLIVGDIWVSTATLNKSFIVREKTKNDGVIVEYLHDKQYGKFRVYLGAIHPKTGCWRKSTKLDRALK